MFSSLIIVASILSITGIVEDLLTTLHNSLTGLRESNPFIRFILKKNKKLLFPIFIFLIFIVLYIVYIQLFTQPPLFTSLLINTGLWSIAAIKIFTTISNHYIIKSFPTKPQESPQ